MKKILFAYFVSIMLGFACNNGSTPDVIRIKPDILYTMPSEEQPHEGTWLQWPHEYQYGVTYRNRLDKTWIDMTKELVSSEKVHLIVYDATEQTRVTTLLTNANVPLTNIDFKIYKTDDVWVRDNGPIYVKDNQGNLIIEDWGFNGWGKKAKYSNCDAIPSKIGTDQNKTVVDLNNILINEGGAIEIDGNRTMMACKSSIINANRNPNLSEIQIEDIFTKYLGITKFVWLDGVPGLEITDMHIDGFARFANKRNIVTMSDQDLEYWQVKQVDINTLKFNNSDDSNSNYTRIELPLTQKEVVTTYGKKLGIKGSYINYYVANTVVLVPNYNDFSDKIANDIIQELYPEKKVIGIDVRNLYANGGMIHCVTQQQPK